MNLCTLMYVTFSLHSLPALFFFYRDARLFGMRILNRIIHKQTNHYLKADDTLFIITIRGLLVKTLYVLSIPSMRQNFPFFHLEFVVARSDDARYDVGAFPVGPLFSMCWIFPRWQELF